MDAAPNAISPLSKSRVHSVLNTGKMKACASLTIRFARTNRHIHMAIIATQSQRTRLRSISIAMAYRKLAWRARSRQSAITERESSELRVRWREGAGSNRRDGPMMGIGSGIRSIGLSDVARLCTRSTRARQGVRGRRPRAKAHEVHAFSRDACSFSVGSKLHV